MCLLLEHVNNYIQTLILNFSLQFVISVWLFIRQCYKFSLFFKFSFILRQLYWIDVVTFVIHLQILTGWPCHPITYTEPGFCPFSIQVWYVFSINLFIGKLNSNGLKVSSCLIPLEIITSSACFSLLLLLFCNQC